jgi:hypothetical protein
MGMQKIKMDVTFSNQPKIDSFRMNLVTGSDREIRYWKNIAIRNLIRVKRQASRMVMCNIMRRENEKKSQQSDTQKTVAKSRLNFNKGATHNMPWAHTFQKVLKESALKSMEGKTGHKMKRRIETTLTMPNKLQKYCAGQKVANIAHMKNVMATTEKDSTNECEDYSPDEVERARYVRVTKNNNDDDKRRYDIKSILLVLPEASKPDCEALEVQTQQRTRSDCIIA